MASLSAFKRVAQVTCGKGFVGARVSVEPAPGLTQICQRSVSANP